MATPKKTPPTKLTANGFDSRTCYERKRDHSFDLFFYVLGRAIYF